MIAREFLHLARQALPRCRLRRDDERLGRRMRQGAHGVRVTRKVPWGGC
jgi:hypothetical protein